MRLPEILEKLIPEGQVLYLHERLWLEAPDWRRETSSGFSPVPSWSGFHGGDEYGNCSLYFRSKWLGGVVFFYEPGFQLEVELPEPGVSKWIDRRYYPDDAS